MMVLLDTPEDLDVCRAELGEGAEVGQLITPLTSRAWCGGIHAFDSGIFGKDPFHAKSFLSLLSRHKAHRAQCLFVAAPDVVGSARRTLEIFSHWYPKLHGWPIALVCQDGQEDLPIPWNLIKAVFIGGSTEWKSSQHAEHIVRAARAIGVWSHIGRVNTPGRYQKFLEMGADSCDGTGIARYTHMRQELRVGSPLFDKSTT